MTKKELRMVISPLKGDVIKYIETYFKLHYNPYDSDYRFLRKEAYRILDTDIDFHIQYYDDETIDEIYLCTWSGGWGHQRSWIKVDFRWDGYYNYEVCDRTSDKPIESEYRSDKKEDIFKALDKYFMLTCTDSEVRNIKLKKILGE